MSLLARLYAAHGREVFSGMTLGATAASATIEEVFEGPSVGKLIDDGMIESLGVDEEQPLGYQFERWHITKKGEEAVNHG